MNTLRQITGNTFDCYGFEYGDFPPDAEPGVVPPLAEPYLPDRFVWANDTSIGGKWEWDRAASRSEKIHGVYAGLSIKNPARTSAEMVEIDREIDDSELTTGTFRGHSNGYIYVLEF
jgi:hypothetical protein